MLAMTATYVNNVPINFFPNQIYFKDFLKQFSTIFRQFSFSFFVVESFIASRTQLGFEGFLQAILSKYFPSLKTRFYRKMEENVFLVFHVARTSIAKHAKMKILERNPMRNFLCRFPIKEAFCKEPKAVQKASNVPC